MNDVIKLILELAAMDIRIYLEQGVLKVNAPDGVSLDTVIPRIRQHKAELVSYLASRTQTVAGEITAAPAQEHYALSSAQRRLWILSQLEDGSLAYNMPGIYTLTGELDRQALAAAFSDLIARHESLRTVFREAEGEVRQYIQAPEDCGFTVSFEDARHLADDPHTVEIRVQQELAQPFDLSGGPLLRAVLYELGVDRYLLGFALHHIIGDGWSMEVLMSELFSFYNSHANGKGHTLSPLRIQYKDYAAWEQAQLGGESLAAHKQYWLDQFAGELPVLELPADRLRPAVRTYNGAAVEEEIEAPVLAALKALAQQEDSTLFMALLAAVNALLHRYTGQDDIIVGSPVAGREHHDLRGQIGFYVNTLALRTQVQGDEGFADLLRKVRRQTLEAYDHQVYPFDALVDALNLRSDASRHPLFDVMVQVQERTVRGQELGGLKIARQSGVSNGTSKFDVLFDFTDEGNALRLRIEYNTDIYGAGAMKQLAGHLAQVLRAVTAHPNVPVGMLDYLVVGEKKQLANGFNNDATDYPRGATLVSLFEEQVERTPKNVAVVYEDASLTYEQLNDQANRLASYLRKNYIIEKDTLVCIQLERSVEMIVAIIAVLKSGAAYVPIDPAYPQERIDYMIEDSNCIALINDEELARFHSEQVNNFYSELDQYSAANPERINNASDLAYVIYTSGTTGKPKGSLIEHRNVVRLFVNDAPLFDFSERDVWTMFHSYCFDFSVWEMYGALLFGGKLVVVPVLTAKDPAAYREVLKKEGVTVLNQTPSAFYNLIKEEFEQEDAALKLRYVIFGGEALSPGKLAAWHERYPSTQLINMYGITETTVHVTYKKIGEAEINTNSSNIGKAIPTLSCYVLDDYGQLAPIGVAGELYVGGEGVCRGYLNRPELTERKFIQSPFKQGERLYRSGDKARLLANGELEYGGRIDDQVKIRGYRIELGEVENALRRNDKVEDVVILARKDSKGETSLVAYLTSNEELNTTELRQELAEHLPAYMLPSYYVQLDSFPLTSNGKVNKKALPEPESGNMDSGVEYVAPGTATEETLVAIWKELLGKERISVKDNFFEIGGHSLKATRLASQVYKTFNVRIALKDLFTHVYLEDLARFIDNAQTTTYTAIQTVATAEDYALSSAQWRLWLSSQFDEASIAYNIPAAYIIEGNLDVERLSAAFHALIERHESLRTVFVSDAENTVRQRILSTAELNFSISLHELATADEDACIRALQSDSVRPFDLASGPLLRASLYRLGDGKWLFTFVMHHIVSDGWSMNILIKELLQFYKGRSRPKPLRIQYKDYAAWQQEQSSVSGHKAYWLQQLSGELPVLELPINNARPQIRSYTGDVVSGLIDPALTNAMQSAAQAEGGTLFMALLSAVNTLLYRYTGQSDIIIGSQIAGREHPDLENQIGFYLNTLALRTQLDANTSFLQLLAAVRKTTLDAYAHADYPFDELVEALELGRDAGRNPLFDVTVVLHNTDNVAVAQTDGGLKLQPFAEDELQTSRFDLSFDFNETSAGIETRIVYNTDIFRRATIVRLYDHFLKLMQLLAQQPDDAIADLDYLGTGEKQMLLHDFNHTQVAYPANESIAALFEAQVADTSDRIALVFEGRNTTYKELDAQANRLAQYLRTEHGVRPNDTVGILLDRSDSLMVAILGVLKSGAAYVPVDVDYPAGRKGFMLRDANVRLLITQSDYLFDLDYFSGSIFAIDVQLEDLEKVEALPLVNAATDLAYIMYTSGSTGQPKGVLIEQRGVVRLVKSSDYIAFDGSETILSTGAVSFDATTFEYWGTLLNGGKLVFCPKDILLDEQRLAEQIKIHGVDTMWFTTGWLNQLVDKNIGVFGRLKSIVTGGEKVSLQHIRTLRTACPELKIVHVYGPTENTTFSLSYEVGDVIDIVPIGKPISNSTAYVLDAQGGLCPVGIVGEICVGGDGLARGYLNNEELTAQKFITHPIVGRIYKTGDLGYWMEDGSIEFLGRRDEQVKVRGYRIELSEIENAIKEFDAVEAAVAIVRTDATGEKQIIAYLVAAETLAASDLRAFLSRQLPGYMLPDQFVQLDELPLNANGKVDRKALPQPEGLGMDSGVEYVAPRTETEIRLGAIWGEILNKKNISVKDNFFEIGGHSLKATRLASQIHKEFDVKLELKDIFTKTILEEQARLIDAAARTSFSAIQPLAVREDYALSASQRRMWVLSQFEEGSIAYNMPGVHIFEGDLDGEALSAAFASLIERHEVLRTVFREDAQGDVRQIILPADQSGFQLELHDLRHANAELSELVEADAAHPFNLAQGPLLRASLYQIEDNRWVFTYVLHHIISDGWSMGILIRELLAFYNARVNDQLPELPALRIQYKDYAAWQQEQLSGEVLAGHRTYWLNQFAGELPVLELPTDHSRPLVKTYNGGALTHTFNAGLTKALNDLSQQYGGTLYMTLLAAINTLLYKYSNQNDIIVGSPIAGRQHADLEGQIGFYLNTLALRTHIDGSESFTHLLNDVKQTTLAAYEHQVYPFDQLVDELQLRRDTSRHPLFDVLVILQNAGSHDGTNGQTLQGLTVKNYEDRTHRISKFDWLFDFSQSGDGLQLSLEYNSDIYASHTAERMASHLEVLLEAIISQPKQVIDNLSYLPSAERALVTEGFNDTDHDYPKDKTLNGLFEEQATLRPDAVALVFDSKTFTYGEINAHANQLAHYLRSQYKLQADDLVVVQLERSEWMIISLLAVLKAGAAYVPVDPQYPEERIQYMIEDSGCKAVINEEELARFFEQQAQYSTNNIDIINAPTDLAYVIYTSGSTGKPKGCLLQHQGVVNRLEWMWAHYGFSSEDVILQKTTFTFDVSVWELFLPLCWGARMVLCEREDIAAPERIAQLIEQQSVTCLHFVPGMLQAFISSQFEEKAIADRLQSLRRVITSGEALLPATVQSWYKTVATPLHNLYGPTEASVDVTYYATQPNDTLVPIGCPIWNTQVYITDKQGQPVGIGIVGEINLAGDGLARGYLNRPELTEQKFVANPFNPGTKMYRTGDVGRWLSDGNIEFLGRSDDQVKIRGYRIELGEIETALQQHEAVEAAAVLALSDASGEKTLVAYVITELPTQELRAYLSASLPAYMIPQHFVLVDAMPLTASGKVDRKALAATTLSELKSEAEYIAPRTDIERKLAQIWQDILGRENIGVKDSFFDLGGHSLKATRLASQLHKTFEIRPTLGELFARPLLEEQARLIEQGQRAQFQSIQPVTVQEDGYPISSAQQRLWILSQLEEGNIAYNMPGAYRFQGTLDTEALNWCFVTLIERHESLRTLFAPDSQGNLRQYIKAADEIGFTLSQHDLRSDADREAAVQARLQEDAVTPFNLVTGPLVRASLYQVEDDQWVLGYVLHHIISDGWSMGLLLKELLLLYNARVQGLPNPLEPLRIHYKDYAAWQQAQLSGASLEQHKSYWLDQFSGELPLLELPGDRPRPAVKSYNGSTTARSLGQELSASLKTFTHQRGATLYMGLLAGVKALLYRYTGQEDLVIGSPIAGREHSDLEEQIGFYVNMLAVRTQLKGAESFEALLSRVRQTTLKAYEHQVYPFDELVEEVHLSGDTSRHALFDVVVVLQNTELEHQLAEARALQGLHVTPYQDTERVVSLFDLRFDFKEVDGNIDVLIEYNADIYSHPWIEQLSDHLLNLFQASVQHPAQALASLDYLSDEERTRLLVSFNDTAVDRPRTTLVQLFAQQVAKDPTRTAVIFRDETLTYGELEVRANRLANFLVTELQVPAEARIGILLARGHEMIVAIMATLKAGCAYVPLEADYPESRLLYMIEDAGIEVVLTEKKIADLGLRLQWRSSGVKHLACIDSDDIHTEKGRAENELMSKDLWDYVGDTATNAIAGGGWMSSYTGEDFSEEEMREYSDNIYLKLKRHLRKDMKVLEVGCSSGLTLFRIAPEVGAYHGTDLSSSILANTARRAKELGQENVSLTCLPADALDQLADGDFDLVIINSVIHCFDGHNYLRDVLRKVIGKMKASGLIFLGDVMDEELRDALVNDLTDFKKNHRNEGYRTKTDWSKELFVARDYLTDLIQDGIGIAAADFSGKIHTIENELTRYRYDALLHIDKENIFEAAPRSRYQHDRRTINNYPAAAPAVTIDGSNLAYVIYTSGSTGKPKGCMLEHHGVVNRIEWMWNHYGFSHEDVVLQKTTFTFDVSVWELFLPLCWGTTMVQCEQEDIGAPERIVALIEKQGVTCLHFVPSMMNAFLSAVGGRHGLRRSLQTLRKVMTSGEALLPETVAAWYKELDIPVYNLYGPTEASIDVTYYDTHVNDTLIPIGRPIDNTDMYVLDSRYALLPVGVVGEICIGGDGLARGYLNNPSLTDEKFVPHPFKNGYRIYTSGDLGRWLPDGTIEYMGRKDAQVKIRGHRIELGEIESALQQHPGVDAAAVIARPNKAGEQELVAYLVSREVLNTSDLGAYLSKVIPAYMMPTHYVQLDKVPLTSSGKLNRKALPDPARVGMDSGVSYVAPRNEVEKKLVEIWQDILGRERIGVKDNFFDLGGHSLKATRLSGQIHKAFDVKVELRELFTKTRLEEQARLIQLTQKIAYTGITPVAEAESYTLSSSQRRLWVLSQFEEGNVAYNIPSVYVFEGELDGAALADCLHELTVRHESLRTVFREDESGEVRQYILPSGQINFITAYHDLRNDDEQPAKLQDLVHAAFTQAFDLENGPLLRAALYRLDAQKWVFSYVMHHIISDGWSMNILVKELLQLYNARIQGQDNPLPPLAIQYKDYAAWQQQQLSGEALKRHKDYWMQQFAGELPVLALPGDRPRPLVKTYRGGVVSRTIAADTAHALKTLSQSQGGTLFMGLLAAVNALLYRYTGDEDQVIGSPIAGRAHADLEDQIGFYLNTLALRTQLSGGDSFRKLLGAVRQATLNAYEHQIYPFDELVDELNPERDMSRHPLFDVMVILQNTSLGDVRDEQSLGGLKVSRYAEEQQVISKFDLTFDFREVEGALLLGLEYNSDIYQRATAERMAAHFAQLVEATVAQPGLSINELNYIDNTEYMELVAAFNQTATTYDRERTVTELFEARVAQSPEAVALMAGDKVLTYRALNEAVNGFAHYLRSERGVRPDSLVALVLPRSEWLVIALLGVLKSGGAYVPIDPDYPQERISYMLGDSGCKVVIDEAAIESYLSNVDGYAKSNPDKVNSPEDLAYVIYTSGSTGRPKGVMIEHRSVVSFCENFSAVFGLEAGMVLASATNYTFDISVLELVGTLVNGISVVLLADTDAATVLQQVSAGSVDALQLTPSRLNQLVEESPNGIAALSGLKVMLVGGEALSPASYESLKTLNGTKVINVYGPTETTIWSTALEVRGSDALTIGRPLLNEQVFILDERHSLCPVGIAGEICIGGEGLARGYWNNEALTAERFIAHPFSEGKRVYRTGDVGRWLADGTIEYMGRKDAQVKIRGYRIELGEIEHALQQHEAIEAAAVVARTGAGGEQELVAYVVSRAALNTSDTASFLGRKLPAYMLPAHYVQLEALPLTPSGKLNRKALPDPGAAAMGTGVSYVAPRNETEAALAAIWQEILGREQISVKDSFFALGGNSLKATRLASQIHKKFDVKVALKDFFNEPTIEGVATGLSTLLWVRNAETQPAAPDVETLIF